MTRRRTILISNEYVAIAYKFMYDGYAYILKERSMVLILLLNIWDLLSDVFVSLCFIKVTINVELLRR